MNEHLVGPEALRAQRTEEPAPLVIDVRGPAEYATGHVAGAQHLPLDNLARQMVDLPRDRPLVAYCNMQHRGDSRGERAAAQLRAEGFQAQVLDGGFPAWKAAGYPVESGSPADE